jgi:hypothetical protein
MNDGDRLRLHVWSGRNPFSRDWVQAQLGDSSNSRKVSIQCEYTGTVFQDSRNESIDRR